MSDEIPMMKSKTDFFLDISEVKTGRGICWIHFTLFFLFLFLVNIKCWSQTDMPHSSQVQKSMEHKGLIEEIPKAISNIFFTMDRSGPALLCSGPKGPTASHSEDHINQGNGESESGVTQYIVAKVNAHQGDTLSAKELKREIEKSDVNLSQEQYEELQKKFLISKPEAPGVREGTVAMPLHIRITKVTYECKGEFCGWCYHPDPTNMGYLPAIRILPNERIGQQFVWKRLYTGREVDETYTIYWQKIGLGPNPPPIIYQEVEERKSGPQVFDLSAKRLPGLFSDLQGQQSLSQGKICRGGKELPMQKFASRKGVQKKLNVSLQTIQKCCKNFGGLKEIRQIPVAESAVAFFNVEIECKREGEPQVINLE